MASSSPRSRSRALLLFFWTWCAAGGSLELQPANAQDCNHNGVADAEDLAQGASMDCDRDGIPDECEAGFPGEETTSTGWGPVAVIASDLDGDGRLDLATANSNSNDISVLLGNGDGSFKAQLRFAVGLGPGSLVASDLNGDGRFDIVTANLPNLSVLLGNGDGTFQAPRHVDAGLGPAGIIATDFDGATLVTCTAGDASGNQSQCVFEVEVVCERQLPGECNQDGKLDMSDSICLLGHLFLGNPRSLPCGDGTSADEANVKLLDWTGDGSLDISDGVGSLVWLFQGGKPHVLGEDCRHFAGCPQTCR